jgi:P-type conjugative transfer protein TrbJ
MKYLLSVGVILAHIQIHAAFPVFDPANLFQNVLSVAAEVENMMQTAQRIEYQIKSAQRFANKLEGYKFSDIRGLLNLLRSFRNRSRAIGYTYQSIVDQFERTYGKNGKFAKNFAAWQKQSDDSIKDAMVSQGLLEKSETHMDDLNKVIETKAKAEGEAETLHAISEINTIQSKQLADLTHIVATDARARQSVIMEERSKQKELSEYESRLMRDFNDHGKSRPLAYFPSLGSTAPQVQR